MVDLSKFASNNNLLSGVILLRVIPGVTWTQLYIYIYAFYDTLISHNMHSLYNLKVKYSFILSKLIK